MKPQNKFINYLLTIRGVLAKKESTGLANEFKNGVEPTKNIEQAIVKTDPKVMAATINRDSAGEYTKRKMPIFEEALQTSWNSEIPFMHSIVKPDFRRF